MIRLLLSVLLLIVTMTYCQARYWLPALPKEGITGQAEITISSIKLKKTPFGQSWAVQGELSRFHPSEGADPLLQVRNGNVRMTIPWRDGELKPCGSGRYHVYGKLTKRGADYRLTVNRHAIWTAVANSWNLAEWRYHAKETFSNWLERHIGNQRVAGFLSGLATGAFSDPQVATALGRCGLLHVMAISGFHFAIVTALLSLILMLLCPRSIATPLLIIILSAYFVLLGPGASIARAWIAAILVLGGQWLGKRTTGLNTLGVSLLLILLFDPLTCQSIAFQLSFLATGAILLFYSPFYLALQTLLPRRPLNQLLSMQSWDQHAVILLSALRGALALCLAVHVVMIPVTLFYFQKFPWLSLVFNLFFPFLVSVSMCLLLISLVAHVLFPPLAIGLHALNATYTEWLLNVTLHIPAQLDFVLRFPQFSAGWLVSYLVFASIIGVFLIGWMQKKKEEREDFAFL